MMKNLIFILLVITAKTAGDTTISIEGPVPTTEKYTPISTTEEYTPALTTEEYTPAPTTEEYTPAPTTEEYTPAPTTEEYTPAPTTEEYTPAPTTEEYTPAPTTEEYTPAPTTEEYTPTPPTEEYTPAPTTEEYTPAHISAGEYTPAPTTEQYTPAPTTKEYTPAHISAGEYTPAPTTEQYTPAPTTEEYTPTPSTEENTANVPTDGIVTEAAVRLVNGSQPSEGRVEIHMNGVWGTVCDDNFDQRAAAVVCRMLGYNGSTVQVRDFAYFGQGTGPIILDDVRCRGDETHLLECQHPPIGIHNCAHSEDVGVSCQPASSNRVRLVNGRRPSEGRLEINVSGFWGTVCDDNFDERDGGVVCTMLGYTGVTPVVKGSAFYGQGRGFILLDEVGCVGSEADLLSCSHPPVGVHDCSHSEDVGIICQTTSAIRLVNGSRPSEGRVEINIDGVWGTVCDDGFNSAAASVVCRRLGYPGGVSLVRPVAYFGQGSGPILLDDVTCTGSESDLMTCLHPPIGVHNCLHSEDVGVVCQAAISGVRLVNGWTPREGRLEISIAGIWGTVCDDSFDDYDAEVACRMLGYSSPIRRPTVRPVSFYGPGTVPIILDDVECRGYEASLLSCQHAPIGIHDCSHNEDVGIAC